MRSGGAPLLWVEDDRVVQATVAPLLAAAGFDVTCVSDAGEALSAWATRRFDHVLTDVGLPRIDGIALVAALRAAERIRALPRSRIVVLTGEPGRERQARRAGADAVLIKPVAVDRIVAALRAHDRSSAGMAPGG